MVPAALPAGPDRAMAEAKVSLESGMYDQFSLMPPPTPPTPSTAMEYFVPAATGNAGILLCVPPPGSSLLEATVVRDPTALPVYTARRVSKVLVAVSSANVPALRGVKEYQTDFPPALPAWFGSPDSLVALVLDPFRPSGLSLMGTDDPKASLTGGPVHVPEPLVICTDQPFGGRGEHRHADAAGGVGESLAREPHGPCVVGIALRWRP